MQIILLSGGSGRRLWPLSNDRRSKQFLRFLPAPDGLGRESMVQRVVRQLGESGLKAKLTVATSASQKDVIVNQLGSQVCVVTEPQRRDTFPAIALACAYLSFVKECADDEIVVVMPCDPYTETSYFKAIGNMAQAVELQVADLVLMGIEPTYPSTKYGYVVPETANSAKQSGKGIALKVRSFIEKPTQPHAEELIEQAAFWNGGVFAFRLGYLLDIVRKYIKLCSFDEVYSQYSNLPKISFDYEVAEKARSVAVVPFAGQWKDLGTWNTLTEELSDHAIGNIVMADSVNTHIINELELPIMCIGAQNMVVAASRDGILVSDKSRSEKIKSYADSLQHRPMYEERRWGEYKVIDEIDFPDGHKALTKQLVVRAGNNISYQVHRCRDEVWTFIDGEGLLVQDGLISKVTRGVTVHIKKGTLHAVRALTDLRIIEIQSGDVLSEEDIERFDWNWD